MTAEGASLSGASWGWTQSHGRERVGNLILLASLTQQLLLWILGGVVRTQQRHQSNTAKRHALSTSRLGLYALQRGSPPNLTQVRQTLQTLDPQVAL